MVDAIKLGTIAKLGDMSIGGGQWDSLIVAAALQSGSRHLLTEDIRTGQVIGMMTIVSPFVHEPEAILPGL